MSVFIPQHAIKHLDEYKYQSEDRSIITKYILKPFWSKFERIFPVWMAPNMVTLLGLMFIVISDILVFYFDPYYNVVSPKWVYFYHAFAVFMYQTFDACDGIHARRTGQSSPLGELFDHCCDSMNTTLMVIQFASVANLTCNNPLIFLVQFSALANFYLSTWEEFHTHKLFLAEISGPVEGLLMICCVFIFTGVFGVEKMWKSEIYLLNFELLGVHHAISITGSYISAFVGGIVMFFNIYSARRNVIKCLKNDNRENETELALKGLYPFAIYYLTILILFILHPIIITNFTTSMLLTIGACMSFTVGRIITGHLTKQDFPFINFPMFVPVFQAVSMEILVKLFQVDYMDALTMVIYIGLGGSLAVYGMFVKEIVYDITTYLDIWALSIKYPKAIKKD